MGGYTRRTYILYVNDLCLGLAFVLSALTGLVKYPPVQELLSISSACPWLGLITRIHDISGIILSAAALIHLLLHLRWLTSITRSLLGKCLQIPIPGRPPLPVKAYIPVLLLLFFGMTAMILSLSKSASPQSDASGRIIDLRTLSGISAVAPTPSRTLRPGGDAAEGEVSGTREGTFSESSTGVNTNSTNIALTPVPGAVIPTTGIPAPSPAIPVIPGDTRPKESGTIQIKNNRYVFDPSQISTTRPDIFKPGYFSIYDILAHLADKGMITMTSHYDNEAKAMAVTSLNGVAGNWWYRVAPDGGSLEENSLRMELYPYRDRMRIVVSDVYAASDIVQRFSLFKQETGRMLANEGKIIIPSVSVRFQDSSRNKTFTNVEVSSHNLRYDMFQDGVITAIDALLTLRDKGFLSLEYAWTEALGSASIIQAYYVTSIDGVEQHDRCGFIYEVGPLGAPKPPGNLVHVFSDMRILVSAPESILFQWRCL